jgi:protein ImuB
MPRIACLLVPDFALAAILRSDPELRGCSAAVAESDDPRAALVAVSPEAEAEGIQRGLSAMAARAISSRLHLRRPTVECLRAAEAALLDVAESFSPRVEHREAGVVLLDADGLGSLFGSEGHLATSLAARARRVGFEARVGIAATKTAAWLAARGSEGVTVWPPGTEPEALAPLPLSLLDPSESIALTLDRWGVRTLGDLACLPAPSIGRRLGPLGLRLWHSARGEDEEPLRPRARPLGFEEIVDCEYAIDSFEPLSFLLRAALERLITRLDVRALRAGDLVLSLGLEGGGREERTIRVAGPSNDRKLLLGLLRLAFESRPPRASIENFRLSAVPERLRPIALGLFIPPAPAPEDLDVAIARLAAVAGAERVGTPVLASSYRPDAFALERFAPPPAPASPDTVPAPKALALRAFRPPAAIHVVCDRGRPDFVRAGVDEGRDPSGFGGRVVELAGPWRLEAEWWRSDRLERDYYDAELSDGCVYRIYRDRRDGRWFAEGMYD